MTQATLSSSQATLNNLMAFFIPETVSVLLKRSIIHTTSFCRNNRCKKNTKDEHLPALDIQLKHNWRFEVYHEDKWLLFLKIKLA